MHTGTVFSTKPTVLKTAGENWGQPKIKWSDPFNLSPIHTGAKALPWSHEEGRNRHAQGSALWLTNTLSKRASTMPTGLGVLLQLAMKLSAPIVFN